MSDTDLLDRVEAMMDDEGGNEPRRAGRAALWIALDIARSLRDMRWSLERLAQFQQERQ